MPPLSRDAAAVVQRKPRAFNARDVDALLNHVGMGPMVVDHEKVTRTFPEVSGTPELISIYQVEADRIAHA